MLRVGIHATPLPVHARRRAKNDRRRTLDRMKQLRHKVQASVLFIAIALAWSPNGPAQTRQNGAPGELSSQPPVPSGETVTAPEAEGSRPGAAPGRNVKPIEPVVPAGTPYEVDSFLIYPEFDATFFYDDNVFYTNTHRRSDHAWVLSPSIWVQSNWARHALNFQAGLDATRYNTYDIEDTNDYRMSAEGRYDIDVNTNVYGGGGYSKNHEDRESPDARNGLLPTVYFQQRYYAGFFHQAERLSLRIAGTANRLNYQDVPFLTGSGVINIINNDDRDRWQYTGGARLGYEVSPRLEPYLQLAIDNRDYINTPDDLGYQKSSTGGRYLVGVKWNVPRTLKLDAFAGYLTQNFDDPRFSNVNKPVFGGALLYALTDSTRLSAFLDRTLEETTVTEIVAPGVVQSASSYLNTYGLVGINHRLSADWSLRGDVSASRAAYQGIDRTDDYFGATLGVGYRMTPNLYLDFSVAYRKLNSSVPDEDFKKRMAFLRIAVPLSH